MASSSQPNLPGCSLSGSAMASCPVCLGRVSSNLLGHHMSGHTKDEIVQALLRQSNSANDNLGVHFLSESNNPRLLAPRPHLPNPQQIIPPSLFMSQMMVMSSPCLIPQPNGPPILINMPSYVYPNMMMNNITSNPMTSSSHAPPILLPTQPQPPVPPSASKSDLSLPKGHKSPTLEVKDSSEEISLESASELDLRVDSVKDEKVEEIQPEIANISEELNSQLNSVCSPNSSRKSLSPLPGPSRAPPPPYPKHLISKDKKVSGPVRIKIKNRKDEKGIAKSSPSSRVMTVQDTLLSETSSSAKDALSMPQDSSKVTETVEKSSKEVFGFTQYAEDSPYPAASLNFSSMLLEQQQQQKPCPTQPPPSSTQQSPTQQKSSPVLAAASIATSTSTATATATTSFTAIQSTNEIQPNSSCEKASTSSSNSNVYTVQTVSDLKNALESEEDFQIVVPNELLETLEFKSFVSTLNPFPLHDSPSVHHPSSDINREDGSEDTTASCHAPPNTPNTTRPPSRSLEVEDPLSPQLGTSRESGSESSNMILPHNVINDSDDDDITLQDLVAMETMDEACEDDQFFTLSNSTNPLEPFMNAILQVADTKNLFTCEKCGLNFGSITEFRSHKDMCHCSSSIKGKKSTKSSQKNKAKNPTKTSSEYPAQDSNLNLQESDQAALLEVKTEVKAEIKSETLDSTSQPALAATGQNWKCNQCKVVFETGPQLLEHLDLMRTSEHNCASCHIIFDDRKMLLLHRRKFHQSMPKIKVETPGVRDVMPNENGEYVCDKCDRAFRDKELMLKHMSCHDEERPFECLECGKKFTKASLLRDHRKRHFEVGAYECGYCQKRFYTPNKLREHVRVHTGEAPLACGVCGKTFKRHSNLSEHKRIHQENRPVKPPKELFCHCGKVFKTQRDLDWHKEGEHDKQPKKCKYCGEVFVHGSSLTRHIRLKHEANFLPENKKTNLYAKCPVCNQMFYKTSINKHIRIKHHGQKSYQCDICKASFVTKCNLLNHQWQHKGMRARPFKCQLCTKAYLRQSLLDAHMRSHRGVKPFVCNECGLQFANKSNWQRHVVEHSGARNYECPHCPKKFSRGYYLTDHLKVHTGEKPYVCGICGKMAATRSNYNSHLRTHITREPINSEV